MAGRKLVIGRPPGRCCNCQAPATTKAKSPTGVVKPVCAECAKRFSKGKYV